GGTIRAESAGEGQGATFIVELPLAGARTVERISAAGPLAVQDEALITSLDGAPRLDGLRIVAVDDQSDTLDVIQMILMRCGADVRTCSTAGEALDLVQSWRPDLLVADIGMPKEDGYALIQRLRNLPVDQGGKTPAVALTAYARVEDRMKTLSA